MVFAAAERVPASHSHRAVGADRIVGKPGDDIMIGGITSYEIGADPSNFKKFASRDQALHAILAEWTSGSP